MGDTHGVFGDPAELEDQDVEALADEALGYSSTTDSESADDGNEDETPSDAQAPVAETDRVPEQPAMDAATWQAKQAQYEQALQYMAQMTQAMQAQIQQAGLMRPQMGAQGVGLPPTVQQTFGYPAGQAPAFGQPAYAVHGTQSAAAPAAPQKEVNDEELKEQYWEDPVKVTRTLLAQQAAALRAEQEQREALFGQVLGQQILGPLAQQVQVQQQRAQAQEAERKWQSVARQEYNKLKEAHDDLDDVTPVMKQILAEQPQIVAQLLTDPRQIANLYAQAKAKHQTTPALQALPGGKGAARMPRSGAARMQQTSDNDALVEAALGPMSAGGIFG